MEWRFKHPARIQVVGPSCSGKSELLLKLLGEAACWKPPPSHVIYVAPNLDSRMDYLKRLDEALTPTRGNLITLDTIPNGDDINHLIGRDMHISKRESNRRKEEEEEDEDKREYAEDDDSQTNARRCGPPRAVVVIDDLLVANKEGIRKVERMMVLSSHHNDFSVVLCVQNSFHSDLVTINRNLTARILLYQLNDWREINNLNANIFPGYRGFLTYCLTFAKDNYDCNYIIINVDPFSNIPRNFICYTRIFKNERVKHVQSEKNPADVISSSPVFFDLYDGKHKMG
jgi:hypothetical protein